MKTQTKDRMDEKLEIFTLRTIANKTSRSTENDWTNLTFVDLKVKYNEKNIELITYLQMSISTMLKWCNFSLLENIVVEEENAGNKQFHFFLHCFPQQYIFSASKCDIVW